MTVYWGTNMQTKSPSCCYQLGLAPSDCTVLRLLFYVRRHIGREISVRDRPIHHALFQSTPAITRRRLEHDFSREFHATSRCGLSKGHWLNSCPLEQTANLSLRSAPRKNEHRAPVGLAHVGRPNTARHEIRLSPLRAEVSEVSTGWSIADVYLC